jgi:hypothetical protein
MRAAWTGWPWEEGTKGWPRLVASVSAARILYAKFILSNPAFDKRFKTCPAGEECKVMVLPNRIFGHPPLALP